MANNATVTLTGRLIKDPNHSNYNGTNITSFTVAVNTTMKKEGSDSEFESNFYNVSVWGKSGEWLLTRLQKGTIVWVVGDLQLQNYKTKSGEMSKSLSVRADKVVPLKGYKGEKTSSTSAAKEEEEEFPL